MRAERMTTLSETEPFRLVAKARFRNGNGVFLHPLHSKSFSFGLPIIFAARGIDQ
jgi:hypothetical protein